MILNVFVDDPVNITRRHFKKMKHACLNLKNSGFDFLTIGMFIDEAASYIITFNATGNERNIVCEFTCDSADLDELIDTGMEKFLGRCSVFV